MYCPGHVNLITEHHHNEIRSGCLGCACVVFVTISRHAEHGGVCYNKPGTQSMEAFVT